MRFSVAFAIDPAVTGRITFRIEQRLTREQLLDAVWGRDRLIDIRTVDAHVRRLRKALSVHGGSDLIRTVRQAGYSLDDEHD